MQPAMNYIGTGELKRDHIVNVCKLNQQSKTNVLYKKLKYGILQTSYLNGDFSIGGWRLFCNRFHELVDRYRVSILKMIKDQSFYPTDDQR